MNKEDIVKELKGRLGYRDIFYWRKEETNNFIWYYVKFKK